MAIDKLERRNVVILSAIQFFFSAGVAATGSFLYLYFAQLGMDGRRIGFLAGISPAVALVGQGLWGRAADRGLGARKALALTACGGVLVALLFPHFTVFGVIVVLQILTGFFQGPLIPLANAATMHVVSTVEKKGGKGKVSFARIRMYGSVGFAIATSALGIFLEQAGLVAQFYWRVVGLLLIASGALALAVDRPVKRVGKALPASGGNFFTLVGRPAVAIALAAFFLMSFGLSLGNIFLSLHIKDIGGSESVVGLAFTVMSLSGFPVYLAVDRLRHFAGLYPALLLAAFGFSLRWTLTAVAPTPLVTVAVQVLHGLPWVVMYTGMIDFVYRESPEGLKTSSMTLIAALQGSSRILAGLAGGVLYEGYGGRGVFLTSAAITFAGLLILLGGRRFFSAEVGRPLRRALGRASRRVGRGGKTGTA